MSELTLPTLAQVPGWMAAEMPPGYQTRRLEIERLLADLHVMDRIGSVLWETGEPLREAVAALFAALKCEVDAAAGDSGAVVVKLGESRRLQLIVSRSASPVQRTSEELARAFQAVQFADARDRVVFVVNNDPATPPADRPDPVLPDALDMLQRMGVAVVTSGTLFRLWRLSLEDQQKGRKVLDRLHAQDGGPFVIPAR
jgi:hypothetical protein